LDATDSTSATRPLIAAGPIERARRPESSAGSTAAAAAPAEIGAAATNKAAIRPPAENEDFPVIFTPIV
jgi:hypothetical protein